MAEFKDGNIWLKLAFLMTMLGFTCIIFSFAISGGIYSSGDVEGAMIVGYLFLLTAAVLIVCLVFVDEVVGNKIALIFFIIFALVSGLAFVIGFALWGGRRNSTLNAFNTTTGICGALLAILAGIFGILEIVGVKPKK